MRDLQLHACVHQGRGKASDIAAAAICPLQQWTGAKADFADLDKIFPDVVLQFVGGGPIKAACAPWLCGVYRLTHLPLPLLLLHLSAFLPCSGPVPMPISQISTRSFQMSCSSLAAAAAAY
jgi:hypothetical protein